MSIFLKTANIKSEWTDYNGHMNLSYYILLFDLAWEIMLQQFNIGEDSAKNENKTTFAVESHTTYDQELKKKSWFNIGGKSKVFYKAENLKDLVKFLKLLDNKEKIFIIGAGSNTLISDNIFDGVVIKLGKDFNNISCLNDDILIAGSGVLDKSLSEFAMNNNLGGFEFLSCI